MADSNASVTQVAQTKDDNKQPSSKPDITLNCKQCNKDFVFTGGEQDFYQSKGYDKNPLRCSECRRARKMAIRSRGRGRFRGGRGGGNNNNFEKRQPPQGAQPGQCYAFLQGNCKFGDRCRYSHS